MKKIWMILLLAVSVFTVAAADVFVLKSTEFKYPGVPELLKKVLADGSVNLPAGTPPVEIYAGTLKSEPFASVFKKHLPELLCEIKKWLELAFCLTSFL